MANATGPRRQSTAAAFTLVELLLTVALILLLAGAVIFNFGAMGRNARLEEGATQVETLLRFARAQAANSGRQVMIVFNDGSGMNGSSGTSTNLSPSPASGTTSAAPDSAAPGMQTASMLATNIGVMALWEPNPIDYPGQYQVLPGSTLLVDQINELVKVIARRQPDADRTHTNDLALETLLMQLQTQGTNNAAAPDGSSAGMAPITCYPDGSSDSAQLVLGSMDDDDKRFMIVTLSGLTGRVRHELVAFSSDGTMITNTPAPLTNDVAGETNQ
jgi:type II secretory pathway pseudopilin PulG